MKPSATFPKGIILPVVAALAGGGLGWALRPSPATSARPAAGLLPRNDSPLGRNRMSVRTKERIEALHRAGTPSAQCLAVLAFAEIESVAEIRDLLENARFFPPHAAESLAIQTLLRRWLELEPANAMEYCRTYHISVLPELLANYAATHPAEAERLAAAVPGEYWLGIAWRNVCLGLAARDPAAAWAMLQRTPKNLEHEAGKAAGKLAALDFAGAPARIAQLPESIRSYAEGAFAWEMMKADPAAGWEWIRRQPEPAYLIQHTVGETLRRDPDKAFALLASLSPDELSSVRDKWRLSFNLHDTALTSSAIATSTLNPEVKQTLAANFFDRAQQRDPAAATSLFAQLAPETQVKKVGAFSTYWTAKDAAAAEAWRAALPEGPLREAAGSTPEPKPASTGSNGGQAGGPPAGSLAQDFRVRQYINPYDSRLATLTPEGFAEILSAAGPHGQDEYLRTIARQNPAAVTGWLEKSGEITNENGPQIARFFVEWAGDAPAAAAAWTSRQPDGEAARTAAVNVARQYQRYAPADAKAWVDSLPPGPVQQAARHGLQKR